MMRDSEGAECVMCRVDLKWI